jgi:hypothetical protein
MAQRLIQFYGLAQRKKRVIVNVKTAVFENQSLQPSNPALKCCDLQFCLLFHKNYN